MEQAQTPVDNLTQISPDKEPHNVRGFLHRVIKSLESKYHRKRGMSGISTGYACLDELTSGFESGQLVIIAARPSMGKTSFSLSVCANLAIGNGIPVLIFSCNLSGESVVQNILLAESRIDSVSFRNGFLESRDWINVTKAAARLAEAPISIVELRTPTTEQIRLEINAWRKNVRKISEPEGEQSGLVVVDCFSMIRAQGLQNGEKAGAAIARALKGVAEEAATTIIVTAGLSSWVDKHKTGRRPTLSDFTDHEEALADIADIVIFLHCDEANKQLDDGAIVAEVILAKQRHGPTSSFQLAFLKKCGRFDNLP